MAKARTKATRLRRLRAAVPIAVALGSRRARRRRLRRPQSAATLDARSPRDHHRGQRRRSRAARARAAAAADDRRARGDARHDLHARAARARAELAAEPERAAAVRDPGRRPDLSLPAALLRLRSDQRLFRRFARRPQRDDRAVRPARRRSAPRVAGARRASPVHRVDDTVHRPGVRLPAARPPEQPGAGLRSRRSGAAGGARRRRLPARPTACACPRRRSSGRCSAAPRPTSSAGSRWSRPIS